MLEAFFVPFIAILVAELLDKSQMSLLLLATKSKSYLQLLIGGMLGFLIVDGAAVLLGAWITGVFPKDVLSFIAGTIFIIFGILSIRDRNTHPTDTKRARYPFIASFLTILLVEWGDKTQLATALFATQFKPLIVFFGVMTGLLTLSAAAIYLGQTLGKKFDKRKINIVTGVIFLIIGVIVLVLR